MRFGCLLILITIALLCGGGQGLYTAATNPNPKDYSVEKYLQEKPSAKWLRLTGGTLDLTHLNYTSNFGIGHVKEIYVPLLSAGASPLDEIHILVATKDPALLQTAETIRQLKTESEMKAFLQEHGHELVIQKEITGLVRFGIELRDKEERKLRRLNENLAKDFVVIDDGERPEYLVHLGMFLGGIVLAIWLLTRAFGSSKPPGLQPPPLPPQSGRPPPLPNMR